MASYQTAQNDQILSDGMLEEMHQEMHEEVNDEVNEEVHDEVSEEMRPQDFSAFYARDGCEQWAETVKDCE